MAALPPGRVRGKLSDERPPMEMDNRRKKYTSTVPGNNWPREMHPNGARYTDSNTYQQDCTSEHDVKFLGERTSEETVVEVEETGINKNKLHGYPDEPLYVPARHNNANLRGKHSRFNDCTETNVPDAMVTMQKLQKLRELQMKRDMNERYYSQEIKRLIGEYYFGPKMASPALRAHGKLQSASFQPHTENRPRNSLEPCGTMTTITRLNCGCIQETTRPIFTTSKGRVQKRVCSQVEDEEQILKLISSNLQEHLTSPLEQRRNRQKGKSKKHYLDARTFAKTPPDGDQSFEMEEKRIDAEETEIPDRVSRSPSPREKFSNTSTTTN
ncbi:uncharacterized protein LOC122402829 [Colletes gigas]|uniref:uncharacterized protein LOC122402829 n=1 Tax=Colletes gigas TaxID=935657 RepID=UPI001C9A5D23|nr:uncharacterized protein LOC122402829 [Colletes gigas]